MKLTRQQKRALERSKDKDSKEYVMSAKALLQLENKVRAEVLDEMFPIIVLMPLLVLRKEGFGSKRGARFVKEMSEQMDMLGEGLFEINDIYQVVEEEYGFKFEERNGRVEIVVQEE